MKNVRMYENDELLKLQRVELQILEEIIRVCNKYEIKWFTVYGTTIGAIRHQGFIPWDDDIDIGMLREDYEKFLEIAPKELSHGFTLCHYSVDHNVPHYFAKIRKDNTLFVEASSSKLKTHKGIFVDIFSFDKVSKDSKASEKNIKKRWKLDKLFVNKSVTRPCDNGVGQFRFFIKSCIKKIIWLVTCGFSKKYFYQKLDKVAQKYRFIDCDEYVQSVANDPTRISVDDIFPTVKMKFENIEVEVPKNYDKILRGNYGNYMELPPENKRINHAPVKLEF